MKRGRIASRSNSPRAKLIAECDDLWRDIIRLSYMGKCMQPDCGKPGTDAHHLIGRDFKRFRHSVLNGVLLCRGCHNAAHDFELDFMEQLKECDHDRWFFVSISRHAPAQTISIFEWKQRKAELAGALIRMLEDCYSS